MNRKVLPTARLQSMVPRHAPFQNNRRSVTCFALAYEVLCGSYFPDMIRQLAQNGYIAAVEGGVLFQFRYKSIAGHHLAFLRQPSGSYQLIKLLPSDYGSAVSVSL